MPVSDRSASGHTFTAVRLVHRCEAVDASLRGFHERARRSREIEMVPASERRRALPRLGHQADQRDTDRYGRVVAVCRLGTEDIGAWLVSQGWALAYRRYSRDYVDHEAAAKAAGHGIWPGTFVAPWAWRQGKRLPEKASPPPSREVSTVPTGDRCPIKGNISRNGERIYHLPDQQHYAQTRINETNGERWFCTEAEAQAAGWRKVKR